MGTTRLDGIGPCRVSRPHPAGPAEDGPLHGQPAPPAMPPPPRVVSVPRPARPGPDVRGPERRHRDPAAEIRRVGQPRRRHRAHLRALRDAGPKPGGPPIPEPAHLQHDREQQ